MIKLFILWLALSVPAAIIVGKAIMLGDKND